MENKDRDIPNAAEFARPGRLLLDAAAEVVLNVVIFVFRFIGWTFRWTVATVVMFIVMAGAGLYVFNHAVAGDEPVTVPNITGMSYAQAMGQLTDAGLTMTPSTPMESDRVPEGHIISQRPEPGRVIRAGRPVHTTVSRGQVSHQAPMLVNMRASEAETLLVQSGFTKSSIQARMNHPAPKDTVIGQEPSAGDPVPASGEIRLLLSDGPYSGKLLPDLTGMTLEEAMAELERLGVSGLSVQEDRTGVPYGEVFEQDMAPGSVIQPGTVVRYKVRPDPATSGQEPLHREVHVTFSVPGRGVDHTVRGVGIAKDGTNWTLFEKKASGGSQLTVPFYFLEEGTLVILIDGERYRSYYYQGDKEPVVTNHSEEDSGSTPSNA